MSSDRKRSRDQEDADRSSSSSSDSSDERRAKKKKEKKHKKDKKKEKKEKKRHRHQHRTESDQRTVTDEKNYTIIDDSFYFIKNREFQQWLLESKGIYFEDLDSLEGKRLFRDFTAAWNSRSLAAKFYEGVVPEAAVRTKYQWKFADKVDPVQLGNLREEILRDTNLPHLAPPPPVASSISNRAGESGNTTVPPNETPSQREERLERERYEKRKDARNEREQRKLREDELAPKATGKDARIEKKKEANASRRAAADSKGDSFEGIDEYDDGGSGSLKRRIAAQKAAEERRQQKVEQEYEKKRSEYEQKEQAKIDAFRQTYNLAASRFQSGGKESFGSQRKI